MDWLKRNRINCMNLNETSPNPPGMMAVGGGSKCELSIRLFYCSWTEPPWSQVVNTKHVWYFRFRAPSGADWEPYVAYFYRKCLLKRLYCLLSQDSTHIFSHPLTPPFLSLFLFFLIVKNNTSQSSRLTTIVFSTEVGSDYASICVPAPAESPLYDGGEMAGVWSPVVDEPSS